jgi:IstB-like ATP binding protein
LKTSIVITTNRGVGAWGEILGDTTVAAAMLDRLLHRSVVINLDGESYRLPDHQAAAETLRRTTPPAPANNYTDRCSQVRNFGEHTWGLSMSAINHAIAIHCPERVIPSMAGWTAFDAWQCRDLGGPGGGLRYSP